MTAALLNQIHRTFWGSVHWTADARPQMQPQSIPYRADAAGGMERITAVESVPTATHRRNHAER